MKYLSSALKIALVSQFLAICVHVYLTSTHYEIKLGLSEGKGLCNISEYVNCDAVNTSAYSTVFGVPLALWGLMTNLILLLVLLLCWMSTHKEFYRQFSRTLASLVAATSIVMAYVTLTKVNALCIFCLSVYLLSFLTLIAVFKIPSEGKASRFSDFTRDFVKAVHFKVAASLLLAVPLVAFLVNSMIMNSYAKGLDQAISTSITDWKSGKDVDLSLAKGLTKGADISKAKMVIVEFADFQCIHCRHAQPVLANFVRTRPDVTLVFQSFPLDGLCNPAVPRQGDGKSCELAKAVFCGWEQGKGWQLHDWTYENFGHVELNDLTSYAQSIGINLDEWRKCRDLPETLQTIIDQAKLGEKVGVQGTPTIFVNGRVLPRGNSMMVLEAAYNEIKKN